MRPLEPADRAELEAAAAWTERRGWAGAAWYRERLAEDDAARRAAYCGRHPEDPECRRRR